MVDIEDLQQRVGGWFAANARDLPWRRPGTTPWGILVSEVMCQQTPAARVAPVWEWWSERWPEPADLASAATADVLRAWGRLGYPRRALRLQETARAIVGQHAGAVPTDEESLRALPGIGRYTAAAVMAFAFGRRSLVLDTNVRRVLARVDGGREFPTHHETAAERRRAWVFVPDEGPSAALWSAGAMELGAAVCTARSPRCGECPVAHSCAWLAAGRPASDVPSARSQPWEGTDRQCRGRIMAALRGGPDFQPNGDRTAAPSHGPKPDVGDWAVRLSDVAWPDPVQLAACAASLVADGLAVETPHGLTLP